MSLERPNQTPADFRAQEINTYEQTLGRIEQAWESEEATESFINERLAELEAAAEPMEIRTSQNNFAKGFLHPESTVMRNVVMPGLHVDDPELYRVYMDTLREFKNMPAYKSLSLRDINLMAVQFTLGRYFGNMLSESDTEERNQDLYMDVNTRRVSIRQFKGEKMAVCAEKAAVTQNLAAFSGMETYLVLGKCMTAKQNYSNLHAYNVFKGKTDYYLYDPTNPQVVVDRASKRNHYAPALYRLTEQQSQALRQGGQVEIEHVDGEIVNGEQINHRITRIYTASLDEPRKNASMRKAA